MTSVRPYLQIARPDHWIKNVFILPGVALGLALQPHGLTSLVWPVIAALISASVLASANYAINEFLDAESDRHHPTKRNRPSVLGLVKGRIVVVEYVLLAAAGLALAATLGRQYLAVSVALLVMGLAYNVPPLRTKERPYLDVISESVNNPLRLLLGWSLVVPDAVPPSSALLAYWLGGAFLMAAKRYSEYRAIGSAEIAGLYRSAFRSYSEPTLLLSAFFYALSASFFLAIFLVKYRVEFLIAFPLISVLFTWYLAIALKRESAAQHPEKLYQEWRFLLFVGILALVMGLLFFIDLPWLEVFLRENAY